MSVKSACLLSAALSIQIGLTPPNRPPPAGEQFIPKDEGVLRMRTSEVILRRILSPGGPSTYFKYLFWTTALLESVHTTLQPSFLPPISRIPTTLEIAFTALCVAGGFLRLHCFRALGHLFTFQISRQKDHHLITSGAYAYVRHPSYLAAVMTFAGAMPLFYPWLAMILHGWMGITLLGVWYGGLVVMLTTLMARLQSEDEFLEHEFQDEWRRWARDVPWRIFPGVY